MSSLFQPAAKTQRYLKVLLHGGPGTGKTLAALSFPKPMAVIDLEGGTALYPGDYDVLRTKDLRKVETAIGQLTNSNYQTVVLDPLTVIWQLLQDAGQGLVDNRGRRDNEGPRDHLTSGQTLTTREWGIIKRHYAAILTRLTNLPLHVVLIARDTDLYEGKGDQLTKVGIKPDVEKSTPYVADFVFWCQAERTGNTAQFTATVEKERGGVLHIGQRLTGYTADLTNGLFAKHLTQLAGLQTSGTGHLEFEEETTVTAGNTATLETDQQATAKPPVPDPAIKTAVEAFKHEAGIAGLDDAGQTAYAKQQYPGRKLGTLTATEWQALAGKCRAMYADDPAA